MKGINGPGGGSLTCLSCHDGMIGKSVDYPLAQGAASGIPAAFDPRIGRGPRASRGSEHPIGIPYAAGRAGLADLRDAMEKDIKFYGPNGNQVGCASCHNPHSSGTPFSLEKPINDLCSSCHARKASGRHVMAGYGFGDDHPVSGRPDPLRKGRDLSCTTCHAPHGGPGGVPAVSATAPGGTICLRCHRKIMMRP
jgi:predicted CXXCH cytochrome family protein